MNNIYTPKNNPFRDASVAFETTVDLRTADILDVDFEKYISPITLTIASTIDDTVMGAAAGVGVTVDKKELEKALRYDRDQYAAGYRAGKEAASPKWISVEEWLPLGYTTDEDGWKEPEEYIVQVGNAEMATVAMFDGKNFVPSIYGECAGFGSKVTHWMPLPEPPKEEDK